MTPNHYAATLLRHLDAGAPHDNDPDMHQRIQSRLDLTTTTQAQSQSPAPARDRTAAPVRRGRAVRRGILVVAAATVGVTMLTWNTSTPAMASLTPQALATWTATTQPTGDTTTERDSCFREYGAGIATNPAATYLLEERRGELTSMIASYQGNTVFCIVGPDNTGLLNSMSDLGFDVTDRPAAAITAAVSGDDLDGPPSERLHYLTGRYAPDVNDLTLTLTDGRRLPASMQDGWYTAWWTGTTPSTDAQLTWSTLDGSTSTAPFSALPH